MILKKNLPISSGIIISPNIVTDSTLRKGKNAIESITFLLKVCISWIQINKL